jgi:hypothetical protein
MSDKTPDPPRPGRLPLTVRLATWVGSTYGGWRRRRAASRDNAYVRRWKEAWSAGRDGRWAGMRKEAVPYRRSPDRDAWLAGWIWAGTQPDRRNPNRPDRRAQSRGSGSAEATRRRRGAEQANGSAPFGEERDA